MHFLVDTGADITVLPSDLYQRHGLTFGDLDQYSRGEIRGVGASIRTRRVPITMLLRQEHGAPIQIEVNAHVLAPAAGSPPPLLGRDVTDDYRLIIDRAASIVALTDSSPWI